MLKKSLLIAIGALLAQSALADTLSPQEALNRASSQNGSRKVIGATAQPKLAYTAKTVSGKPALYVFNTSGDGTIFLSASDRALPMLGYTDSGSFDPANIPPQLQAWLDDYAAQIEYAENNDFEPVSKNVSFSYPTAWKFIAPLVKTKWDQSKPFNQDLPNTNFATGCVATAMAQIMNYHKYPEIGRGSNTYTTDSGTTYSMNFAQKPFDWDNMINDYTDGYTEVQAEAVAYLMKACGYSTDMTYGYSSGTQSERAAIALNKYFDYDGSIECLERYGFTHTEWATIIYNQLKNVGPVLFSGHSLLGFAHAFVCDGYDGQGYFHINWGWGGLCDGYYSLDAMIPAIQSTGGSDYGGYNFSQGIIINIKKGNGASTLDAKPALTLLGQMNVTNTSSILTITMGEANPSNLANNSLATITPEFGISMENLSTGKVTYATATGTYFMNQNGTYSQYNIPEMSPGSYLPAQMQVRARFDSQLDDGKYKVTFMWRNKSGDQTWNHFLIANGSHDYFYVTKESNQYSIENVPMDRLVIKSMDVISPLYMRNPCQIKMVVSNPNDIELTQSVVPVLLYGDGRVLSFEGDSQLVTLSPNETRTLTLVYTFSSISGGTSPTTSTPREYTLGAYDYSLLMDKNYGTGNYGDSYYGDFGTVTMKRAGNNSTISLRGGIVIDNAKESEFIDGLGFVYGINQFSIIPISCNITCSSGFVAAPLNAVITEFNPETGNGPVVYEKNFEDIIYIGSGETITASTVLKMQDFDVSKIYNITVYYTQQNARKQLGSIKFMASSGVEEIAGAATLQIISGSGTVVASSASGIDNVTVYDINGKTVASRAGNASEEVEIDLSSFLKGLYIVSATDTTGKTATKKIML